MLQHFAQIVHSAETGGLGTQDGTAGDNGLAGHGAELGTTDDAAILAIQIADLTAAHAQVAGGAVDVLADVAVQLSHEGLAEAHDLGIAAAAGVEVGAALSAADGQAGQSILIDLLEAQELDDGQVDGGVKTQAALERAKSRVVLNAVAAVDMPNVVVVLPSDAEGDSALGLDHTLQQANLLILGVSVDDGLQGSQHFLNSLQELGLVGVLSLGSLEDLFNVLVHWDLPPVIINFRWISSVFSPKTVMGYFLVTSYLEYHKSYICKSSF